MDCETAVQAAGPEDAGYKANAAGRAGSSGDQGATGDPTSHGLLSDLEGQYGPRGPGEPDTQSDPCSRPGQCGPGALNHQGGLASPGCPGDEETVGAVARDAPTVTRAAGVSGPGGYAISMAAGPGNQKKIFKLTVPFRCSLEAEMARITMDDDDAQNPQRAVQREIKIKGAVLSVKWNADDFDLLRVSVSAFLEKLSVVMQNIQSIWPFIPRRANREKRPGAEPGDPN